MTPTLLLNTVTIRQASLDDKFRIAAAAGYAGLELWGDELDEVGVHAVRSLSRVHGIPVVGICLHRALYPWHYRWDSRLERMFDARMQNYAAVGAKYVVLPVLDDEGSLEQAAEALRGVVALGERYEITAALEPIGHVAKLARYEDGFALLDAAPGAGFIADVFHFFRGGNELRALRSLDMSRVTAVHLNDAMNLPLDQLLGYMHRLHPGRGIFDVIGFCRTLRDRGYRGPYVLEILNPEYWQQDPMQVGAAGRDACLAVLAAADAPRSEP